MHVAGSFVDGVVVGAGSIRSHVHARLGLLYSRDPGRGRAGGAYGASWSLRRPPIGSARRRSFFLASSRHFLAMMRPALTVFEAFPLVFPVVSMTDRLTPERRTALVASLRAL